MSKEKLEFDVVIVGAGPAGLTCAIKLKQLNPEANICILEKGSEVGAHILSGAVLETKALDELFPNWQEEWKGEDHPLKVKAKEDKFLFLRKNKSFKLPTPPQMKNHGNYIISLGKFCRFLAQKAESLGVQIFPGFPAKEILFSPDGKKVEGVLTAEFGIDKNGEKKDSYQPSIEIRGKYTILGEGCRGSLTKKLEDKFNLREGGKHQTYAIGIKELWKIKPENHKEGKIIHTIGWPLDRKTYGGSFIYHLEDNKVAVGFVIGLDYQNPHLNTFKTFQTFKTHPAIKKIFEGGERISYGARALNEGGFQSIPKLTFPGGALTGCAAGFMNVPKIKGTHTAMKSAILLAETINKSFQKGGDLSSYEGNLKSSWLYKELKKVRNIRPSFKFGLWFGLTYSAIDSYIFRGKAPWTFKHHKDNENLKPAKRCKKPEYTKPDGKITFDLLSSVYLSGTNHEEDQPTHLKLTDTDLAISHNLTTYNSPESNYCPAGVYEVVKDEEGNNRLQINSQNCVHCKTCDIKDPGQNINWVTPEGGGGPNYTEM